MCRPSCFTPDFRGLPPIPGVDPRYREVHGCWMTEDEYRLVGWHSRGTYAVGDRTEHLWMAPVEGHMAWARRTWEAREGRIAAAITRRERDEAYSAAVLADIDRRDAR